MCSVWGRNVLFRIDWCWGNTERECKDLNEALILPANNKIDCVLCCVISRVCIMYSRQSMQVAKRLTNLLHRNTIMNFWLISIHTESQVGLTVLHAADASLSISLNADVHLATLVRFDTLWFHIFPLMRFACDFGFSLFLHFNPSRVQAYHTHVCVVHRTPRVKLLSLLNCHVSEWWIRFMNHLVVIYIISCSRHGKHGNNIAVRCVHVNGWLSRETKTELWCSRRRKKNLFACVVVVTVIDVARALAGVPLLISFFSHQFENSLADISDRFFFFLSSNSRFVFSIFFRRSLIRLPRC